MNIWQTTFTGLDDNTDLDRVWDLSQKYDVEWGVLFSQTNQGTGRYPSYEFLKKFIAFVKDHPFKISLHLCGKWSRDLLKGNFSFQEVGSELLKIADRIQINMTDNDFHNMNFFKVYDTLNKASCSYLGVILQTKRPFERAEEAQEYYFDMLYDVSGGKGVEPKEWAKPPEANILLGYAGGLGPENIVYKLEELERIVGKRSIWIDMETKVRNEKDQFDLDKVEQCLKLIAAKQRFDILTKTLKVMFPAERVKISIDGNEGLLQSLKDLNLSCMMQRSAWSDFEININI